MTRTTIRQRLFAAVVLVTAGVASSSCGEVARTGRSPVAVVIDNLEGASGAQPSEYGNLLYSDVQTIVEQTIGGQQVRVPTIYSDLGRARFRLNLKNPGSSVSPLSPSPMNDVTLRRYRVRYTRTDGRNTPGVDVPYGFDGTFTLTIGGAGTEGEFELVRHAAKEEPPLRNLVGSNGAQFIMTIAEITFYGVDQAGNEVVTSASMTVNFGDWGDPR